jgi:hypothetical protein
VSLCCQEPKRSKSFADAQDSGSELSEQPPTYVDPESSPSP